MPVPLRRRHARSCSLRRQMSSQAAQAFATPQDAEAAFYEAIERCDLEAMMAVWAADEEVVCIHPNGARLSGFERVRESWRKIFAGGQRLRFDIRDQHYVQGPMLAIHVVHERVVVHGGDEQPVLVVSTNVYQRVEQGWRMILHHASPTPDAPLAPTPKDEKPRVLH